MSSYRDKKTKPKFNYTRSAYSSIDFSQLENQPIDVTASGARSTIKKNDPSGSNTTNQPADNVSGNKFLSMGGKEKDFVKAFGDSPTTQRRKAKAGRDIKRDKFQQVFKDEKDNIRRSRQDVVTDELIMNKPVEKKKSRDYFDNKGKPDPVKKDIPTFSFKIEKGISKEQAKLETKKARLEKRKQRKSMNTPLNYLNPNTMEVQGDAGQVEQPSRAGRPVNSNVLMNDPMNYQDPSKVSAQQTNQEQLFSGLASSMGENPEPMIPGMTDQSITPGQPAPFNMNGGPTDPPKKKLKDSKRSLGYPLAQSISLDKKDTISYEMRPGKTTMENIGTKADGTPNIVPSTTYTKNRISNKEYANRIGNRAKTPFQKKSWISKAIKKPGQLHRDLGVPEGEKIPSSKLDAALAGNYGKKTKQRAELAKTLKSFKK